MTDCLEIWEPQHLEPKRPVQVCIYLIPGPQFFFQNLQSLNWATNTHPKAHYRPHDLTKLDSTLRQSNLIYTRTLYLWVTFEYLPVIYSPRKPIIQSDKDL
jgi:hypothetical protein